MRKYYLIIFLMLSYATYQLLCLPAITQSASFSPQVIIAQLKVTTSSGQFITLYNNSDSLLDLSSLQLQYFNSSDLSKATSSKLIKLSGMVPAHGYAVVNDGPFQACYQATINSVSLGLSTTAGMIQVAHFYGTNSPQVISTLDDYVAWSKAPASGAQVLPPASNMFLQRQEGSGQQKYQSVVSPGAGSWQPAQQPDESAPCTVATGRTAGGAALGSGRAPVPYSVVSSAAALSSIPADDNGLAAPQISEVVPNPAPPKTDDSDEYIELYNSNGSAFDLSGFILQVGTTTTHKYTFPAGTSIEPKKFSAFYSSDTGLSLSNNDGQVELLDPDGNLLGQTDEYTGAKDDYAWVQAGGLWQWTTKPTPGASNIIVSPATKATAASTKAVKPSVKAARTVASASSAGTIQTTDKAAVLHPLVLAGVGFAALIYALYEYRHDLANLVYRLRRDRAARRAIG